MVEARRQLLRELTARFESAPPEFPDADERERLLGGLASLCAAGGAGRLLTAPITPSKSLFGVAWTPTPAKVVALMERLAAAAKADTVRITVEDCRLDALLTDRRRVTDVEPYVDSAGGLRMRLYSIGNDDVAGTLAHEIGVALALSMPQTAAAPYREAAVVEGELTDEQLALGSVAAVWAGLGILAANAAHQVYRDGAYRVDLGFAPSEQSVVGAGYLPLSSLAFLIAVQAELRGSRGSDGLGGPQLEMVRQWSGPLLGQSALLHKILGIDDASGDLVDSPWPSGRIALAEPSAPAATELGDSTPFASAEPALGGAAPGSRQGLPVYRTEHRRTGLGIVGGLIAGAAVMAAVGGDPLFPVLGFGAGGALVGRKFKHDRCATCLEPLVDNVAVCPRCGGIIGERIAHRDLRLDGDESEFSDDDFHGENENDPDAVEPAPS